MLNNAELFNGFMFMKVFNKEENSEKGFSLIEMLVVLAIIGILAGIVLVSVQDARKKAKIVQARLEIKQIFNAISMLEIDTEQWPGHKTPYKIETGASGNEICGDGCTYDLNDCRAGLGCDDGANHYPNWKGPYMENIPKDPWDNEYFLDTDYDIDPGAGEKWAIIVGSYGPNGQGLNLYDGDDVIYVVKE